MAPPFVYNQELSIGYGNQMVDYSDQTVVFGDHLFELSCFSFAALIDGLSVANSIGYFLTVDNTNDDGVVEPGEACNMGGFAIFSTQAYSRKFQP